MLIAAHVGLRGEPWYYMQLEFGRYVARRRRCRRRCVVGRTRPRSMPLAMLTRFPSLVLIRQVLTEIQRFKNVKVYKEMYMYGHPDAVRHSVRMPYISLLILTFLNCYISVKTSLINTKLFCFGIL